MNKLIGVGFEFIATLVLALRGTAVDALAVAPGVLDAVVDDVSLRLIFGKLIGRKLAAGKLTAIDAAARKQTGKFGDGDAKELPGEDVLNALLQIGNL